MSTKEIVIDTSKISPYRGRAIGRAFYNAYMEFIKDPENAKMIERRAEEIREQVRKEKNEIEHMDTMSV